MGLLARLFSKFEVLASCSSFVVIFYLTYAKWQLKTGWALVLGLLASIAIAVCSMKIDDIFEGNLNDLAELLSNQVLLPLVKGVLNYLSTLLLASFLRESAEIADEFVQPKLLLMSLKLGAKSR